MMRDAITATLLVFTILVVMVILNGCAFERGRVTPREIYCRAECTPDAQFIECQGVSEGTETYSLEVESDGG